MHNPTSFSPAIEIAGLTVAYAGERALDEVSLTIQPGRVTAILGPSGCGKSTLLRTIAGLRHPTSGDVRFVSADGVSQQLRPGELGYVFQDPALLPWRDASSNVAVPLELVTSKRSQSQRREQAEQQLAAVGLAVSDWHKLPTELSGGMRMRVSIARALVTDPAVLLLDEPFSALDELLRRRLGDLVLELWRSKPRTIVLVTHNIDEAILMSDHIVVMSAGRIFKSIELTRQWTTEDPRRDPQFSSLYGVVADTLRESAR